MNQRTARLLRRVARVSYLGEHQVAREYPPEQRPQVMPESIRLSRMKRAWNETPAPQRFAARKGLVAIFNEIVLFAPRRPAKGLR